MNIKSNIDELIKESGLRDSFIREKLEIKQHQLRKIKKGESYPTVPKLFILADVLGCKVDDLYTKVEEEE